MALDNESFNKQLYDLLKVRGYKPVPKNAKNQDVEASQLADVIEFQFTKDGENYGKAWASIDDAQNVVIYYDEEQADSPEGRTPGMEYDDSWSGFLQHVKSWAQRKQLSFELLNRDRLSDDMRQREYLKMKENINEGYYPMGKQASYSDAIPTVKIVLQHTRQIQEGEQRYRNIAKIFLENQLGERILAPTVRPGIAQVYARHLAEGGMPNDERWNHIKGICEEYNKMAGFVRATRNGQFNESAQALVNEGINHYQKLRESLSKMRGHRGYNAYFESWTPTLMEDEAEETNLNELFVQETVDPRIESAMPILSRLRKNVSEMSEIATFESWADDVINEKLEMDSTTKSLAVPADEMLEGEIGDPEGTGKRADDRKLLAKDADLLNRLEKKALDKAKSMTSLPPKKIKEAPGAETLAHNQNTEKSNLKAFDLAEKETRKGQIDKGTIPLDEKTHNDTPLVDLEDYKAKKKVLQDLLMDPDASKDPNYKKLIQQRLGRLEQQKAQLGSSPRPDDAEELEPQGGRTALSKAEKYADDRMKKKGQFNPDTAFDMAKAGTLAYGALSSFLEEENMEEGMMKHKMHADAEKMSLEDFCDKYGDEDWIKEFWRDSNGGDEEDELKEVDMGQADRTLRHSPKGDDGKMSHVSSLNKAAKKMGHDSYADVPDDAVAKLKALAKKIRGGEEVEEGLDANQKRAGQLGPTEKVGPKGAVGKLVGANESKELDPLDELKRLLGK